MNETDGPKVQNLYFMLRHFPEINHSQIAMMTTKKVEKKAINHSILKETDLESKKTTIHGKNKQLNTLCQSSFHELQQMKNMTKNIHLNRMDREKNNNLLLKNSTIKKNDGSTVKNSTYYSVMNKLKNVGININDISDISSCGLLDVLEIYSVSTLTKTELEEKLTIQVGVKMNNDEINVLFNALSQFEEK
jgi:hypothetical protein